MAEKNKSGMRYCLLEKTYYQMKIGMAQAAVLDVDVNVKVAGSNTANLKLFEFGLFGLLADGGDFVGGHFLCRAKNIDWVV
jgi:hypothetical protein